MWYPCQHDNTADMLGVNLRLGERKTANQASGTDAATMIRQQVAQGEGKMLVLVRAVERQLGGAKMQAGGGFVVATVIRITHHRVTARCEMATDLMLAPGTGPDFKFRRVVVRI